MVGTVDGVSLVGCFVMGADVLSEPITESV